MLKIVKVHFTVPEWFIEGQRLVVDPMEASTYVP